MWRRVLPAAAFLDVRYEDVVADLQGQARRLTDYCDLPWDERCLSFHNTAGPDRERSTSPQTDLYERHRALARLWRRARPAAERLERRRRRRDRVHCPEALCRDATQAALAQLKASDATLPLAAQPFGFLSRVFISRYRAAPPSRLFCGLRSTASASPGTSLLITEPEPT
jgi:Sulfotransferase family